MIRKYILPILALAGVGLAAWTAMMGARPVPAAAPVAEPSRAPFASYLAGAGIVEASSENISASTPVPGMIVEVMARPNAIVKAGEPLFRLDDRDLRAELDVKKAGLEAAHQQLARLEASPRAEEIPPVEARFQAARADADSAKDQLRRVEAMTDKRAMSEEDLSRRRFASLMAEARAAEAKSQLDLLKAGAWAPDLAVARAQIASAESEVRATQVAIDRLVIRSPVDATVLQVNVRPSEYARTGDALVILGTLEVLHVRIDIDENDAWRFHAGAAAVGFVRGNRDLTAKLQFVRIEPFVIPKKSLTGASQERVDTRVMQVIYRFDRETLPLYVGQQMDVVIEAPPVSGAK